MKLIIILLFPFMLLAQEKGYIDMHGGKKDNLTQQSSGFSKSNTMQSPFGLQNSKDKEQKKYKKPKENKK